MGTFRSNRGSGGGGFENKLSRIGEFEKLGEVKIDLQRVRGYKSNKGSHVSWIILFLFPVFCFFIFPTIRRPTTVFGGGFTYVSNVVTVSLEGDNLSRSNGRHGDLRNLIDLDQVFQSKGWRKEREIGWLGWLEEERGLKKKGETVLLRFTPPAVGEFFDWRGSTRRCLNKSKGRLKKKEWPTLTLFGAA